jgi:hypothetical protein
MPKVNTGGLHVFRQNPESLANCALCTAAALTNQTSGDVNMALQDEFRAYKWFRAPDFQTDDAFNRYAKWKKKASKKGSEESDVKEADTEESDTEESDTEEADPLVAQIESLADYVKEKLKTKVAFSVEADEFVKTKARGNAAIEFMNRQPDGTKFAVYTEKTGSELTEPHWIYAEKQNRITFTDFQLDREVPLTAAWKERLGNPPDRPVVHTSPLGPNNTVYENPESIFMFVLAFGGGVGQ